MKMPKYIQTQLTKNSVVIIKEKHCDRVFYCKSQKDYEKMALKLLKERLDIQWYYDDEYSKTELDIIEACQYAGAIVTERNLDKVATRVKNIVKSKDGLEALLFLFERRHYEYERFYIERPEKL